MRAKDMHFLFVLEAEIYKPHCYRLDEVMGPVTMRASHFPIAFTYPCEKCVV